MPSLRDLTCRVMQLFRKAQTPRHCPKCGFDPGPPDGASVVRYYEGQYWRSEILPPETKRKDDYLLDAIRDYNAWLGVSRKIDA